MENQYFRIPFMGIPYHETVESQETFLKKYMPQ